MPRTRRGDPAVPTETAGVPPGSAPIPEPSLPLASADAEEAVLGGLLLHPEYFPPVTRILPDPTAFYFTQHQRIYEAMLRLNASGVTIDYVTLPEEVAELHGIDPQETKLRLADMVDQPGAMRVEFHAQLVRELSDRRESYGIVRNALEAVAQRGTPFRELLAAAVGRLAERIRPPSDDAPIMRTLVEAMDDIETIWKAGAPVTGLPSGLGDLDSKTHGFQPEHLVVVAGRPAAGKTQFALHLTHQACTREDPKSGEHAPWPVLFDSLEMTRRELVKRLLKAEARMDWWSDIAREVGARPYMDAGGRISQWPLEIEEQCYTISQLRLRLELFRRRYPEGPALVVVDYLSHLRLDYSMGGDRRDAMIGEQITRPAKRLARDFGVCVLLLAQLNRAGARARAGKGKMGDDPAPGILARPTLTDLRDSGDIEQDADQVVFLHPLGPSGAHRQDGRMELGLEKNRHGPSGWVDARFESALGRYSEWPKWDRPRYSSPAPEEVSR